MLFGHAVAETVYKKKSQRLDFWRYAMETISHDVAHYAIAVGHARISAMNGLRYKKKKA